MGQSKTTCTLSAIRLFRALNIHILQENYLTKHYLKNKYIYIKYAKCSLSNVDGFLLECINFHHNVNIVTDKRTIFMNESKLVFYAQSVSTVISGRILYIKKWYKSVIFLIRHVLDPNRTSLCFDEFKRKFLEEEIFSKTNFLLLKVLSEPLRGIIEPG